MHIKHRLKFLSGRKGNLILYLEITIHYKTISHVEQNLSCSYSSGDLQNELRISVSF